MSKFDGTLPAEAADALSRPPVTEEMVERGAQADDPDIWNDDPHIAHRAASPFKVDDLRRESRERVRAILTAALGTPNQKG